METIAPDELKAAVGQSSSLCLIDVRTPAEFREFHIKGAVNLPLDSLSADKLKTAGYQDGLPVFLLCKSGARAKIAAERLAACGISRPICVAGGSLACRDAGLEIEQSERRVISFERQVRIASGFLVLLGVIAGTFLNSGWYALGALAGAGLIFAGVTDQCGMSLLIGRMPWNR